MTKRRDLKVLLAEHAKGSSEGHDAVHRLLRNMSAQGLDREHLGMPADEYVRGESALDDTGARADPPTLVVPKRVPITWEGWRSARSARRARP